jgi:hypothetical protein
VKVILLANDNEIDCHGCTPSGQQECQNHSIGGNASRDPRPGAEFTYELKVPHHGTDIHNHAECHQCHSRPDREPCRADWGVGFIGAHLSQKQSEPCHGKPHAHESQPRANPGKKSSFSGEINPGILFHGILHFSIIERA